MNISCKDKSTLWYSTKPTCTLSQFRGYSENAINLSPQLPHCVAQTFHLHVNATVMPLLLKMCLI